MWVVGGVISLELWRWITLHRGSFSLLIQKRKQAIILWHRLIITASFTCLYPHFLSTCQHAVLFTVNSHRLWSLVTPPENRQIHTQARRSYLLASTPACWIFSWLDNYDALALNSTETPRVFPQEHLPLQIPDIMLAITAHLEMHGTWFLPPSPTEHELDTVETHCKPDNGSQSSCPWHRWRDSWWPICAWIIKRWRSICATVGQLWPDLTSTPQGIICNSISLCSPARQGHTFLNPIVLATLRASSCQSVWPLMCLTHWPALKTGYACTHSLTPVSGHHTYPTLHALPHFIKQFPALSSHFCRGFIYY